MVLRGSCQCGGVRFELPETFEARAFCHCTTCKKLSGGGATANGRIHSDEVKILEGEELLRTYQPEEGSAKTFCSVCGSNLFGGGWPESDQASVRLSAIDSPFESRPRAHIWVRSVASWETLPDDGLERFEASPG
ncbi:MAG: GFA family protein [Actinomycetota bacterium]|nr:GFA family protein [Actinomycetota bacterium]MDQ2982028.1 GFA family protein [Actinomycetota bacterium]